MTNEVITSNEANLDELESFSEEDINKLEESTPEVENNTPKHSEEEELAMKSGWNPDKDTYEKDNPGKKWRPADVFNERGEFFNALGDLKTEVNTLRTQNKTLIDYAKTARESERDRVIQELKEQQNRAVEEGDTEAVQRITDQMIETKSKSVEIEQSQQTNSLNAQDKALADEFIAKNPWFTSDQELHMEARALMQFEIQKNPNLPLSEGLKVIRDKIIKLHPDKFNNEAQGKPATVVTNTSSAQGKPSNDVSYNSLTSQQKSQAAYLKGVLGDSFNMKKYIEDIKRVGG